MKKELKKLLFTTVAVATTLIMSTMAYAQTAVSAPSKVKVDGSLVSFDTYNIEGNNYFKLRDVAMALNGTNKEFNVTWDGNKNAISIISDTQYKSTGGELEAGDGKNKTALVSDASIYVDGKELDIRAFNINGSTYFSLRDIGQPLNFLVSWDEEANTVILDTTKDYGDEDPLVAFAIELTTLVNEARREEGMPQIQLYTSLSKAAQERAEELQDLFSHTRPDGRSCFTILTEYGFDYTLAAENIAAGQYTPEDVFDVWMASPDHKANILKKDFRYLGIGYVDGAWVQLFLG